MDYVYEEVNPSLIENTKLEKVLRDGVNHIQYRIQALPGYVLHDSRLDWEDIDPETREPVFRRGYTRGRKTFAASYDFAANPFEFYAVPDDSVPADQIFGGGNDHEIA